LSKPFTITARCSLVLPFLLLLSACASYEPSAVDVSRGPADIYTDSANGITVSTTILSDALAQSLYGVDLAAEGLQAVWLRIENRSAHAHWLLVPGLDADYYPPGEAAALFRAGFDDTEERAITEHFRELAIPLKSVPGTVNEGYVLTPRHEGGRYIVVELVGSESLVNFGFAVTLPDGDFDFERLDPLAIYGEEVRPDLDLESLRTTLHSLPCCVQDESGERNGDPLNLVVIGQVRDVLAAMSHAGWSFTHRIDFSTAKRMLEAALAGNPYPVAPVSPLYYLGRPQDMALQRARANIAQRNHLRLWLAPFRFEGRSVWIGQVSRDVAVKVTTKSSTLTTHVIDPNVDEAREHLLQSLMVAGAIERFGFVEGMEPVTASEPLTNLTDDPYFTDGLRLIVMVSSSGVVSPEEITFMEWQRSVDPIRDARGESTPVSDEG
jgi:hypothetical protein